MKYFDLDLVRTMALVYLKRFMRLLLGESHTILLGNYMIQDCNLYRVLPPTVPGFQIICAIDKTLNVDVTAQVTRFIQFGTIPGMTWKQWRDIIGMTGCDILKIVVKQKSNGTRNLVYKTSVLYLESQVNFTGEY